MSWQQKSEQIHKEMEAVSPAYEASWGEKYGIRVVGLVLAIPCLFAVILWLQSYPFAKTIPGPSLGNFICEGKDGQVAMSKGFAGLIGSDNDVTKAVMAKLTPGNSGRKAMMMLSRKCSIIRSPRRQQPLLGDIHQGRWFYCLFRWRPVSAGLEVALAEQGGAVLAAGD